jgi:hypothetical protein
MIDLALAIGPAGVDTARKRFDSRRRSRSAAPCSRPVTRDLRGRDEAK